MAGDFLSQILGSVLGNSMGGGQPSSPGGLGGLGGLGSLGGLGGMLGSVLGQGSQSQDGSGSSGGVTGGGAMLAMLLPLAMQWVQRNGGIGAVVDRFRQQGAGQQVASWVSTGDNQPVSSQTVTDVIGSEDLSRMSQQLGVSQEQVASGLAHILPHVVNHLTPDGEVPHNVDDLLSSGLAAVEGYLARSQS
jgi:uncharacterized protein YidB (DUF937 family)